MRILVVEDEPKIAQSIKRALEIKLFAVDVVLDGDSGLAMALDEPYDLIILDIMVPGSVDGLDICKALRDRQKQMAILILTARDAVTDRVRGLELGADDYLTKPFALAELFARVHSLLRRPRHMTADRLTAASLELNSLTFEVRRADKEVRLSKKEFALLEYLMRHPGQTLSKEIIIAHVWNYDANILPNTVEACIKRIRAKVDLAFPDEQPVITTVYGFGYKVEA
jgi:DNA-binding response OmpR family regulator